MSFKFTFNNWLNNNRGLVIFALLVIGAIIFTFWYEPGDVVDREGGSAIAPIEYSEFSTLVDEGKVDAILLGEESKMVVYLYNSETKNMSSKDKNNYVYALSDKRVCTYPDYEEFTKDVMSKGVRLITDPKVKEKELMVSIRSLIIEITVMVLMFGIMFSMLRTGTSKKSNLIKKSDKKFEDVIGHDETIEDIKFIVDLIKNPHKGDKIGAKIPKGILFEGPPGSGKTLLAKAIAGEADVPFIEQTASNFIELYVGVGARRVRELFSLARQAAPCILFIDEIDAIGGKRSSGKNNSENDQTINQLLTEMDGFTGREGIFIIAATNNAENLDSALVRSGRFDRRIVVNPPSDSNTRSDLFKHYLSAYTCRDDIDYERISKQTTGFTGADIEMVCNEASIRAMMNDLDAIDDACIEEAIDSKLFKGGRSKKGVDDKDKEIVAYHEAGHAVMSYLLGEPIVRASIQGSVSGVGGAVIREDKQSRFQTRRDFENSVKIAYAGRASEEIKFDDVTTGASNDITQATKMIMAYIENLGFDDQFGLLDMSEMCQNRLVNSDTLAVKMREYSVKWYSECKELLDKNYQKVEVLAKELLDKESIPGDKVTELLDLC